MCIFSVPHLGSATIITSGQFQRSHDRGKEARIVVPGFVVCVRLLEDVLEMTLVEDSTKL